MVRQVEVEGLRGLQIGMRKMTRIVPDRVIAELRADAE